MANIENQAVVLVTLGEELELPLEVTVVLGDGSDLSVYRKDDITNDGFLGLVLEQDSLDSDKLKAYKDAISREVLIGKWLADGVTQKNAVLVKCLAGSGLEDEEGAMLGSYYALDFQEEASEVAKQEDRIEKIVLSITGAIRTFPKRVELITKLEHADRDTEAGGEVELFVDTYGNNEKKSGIVRVKYTDANGDSDEIGTLELDVLPVAEKALVVDMMDKTINVENEHFIIMATKRTSKGMIYGRIVPNENIAKKQLAFEKKMASYMDNKIMTKQEFEERYKYLEENNISKEIILEIFQSMVKYPEDVEAKIPERPQTLFIDNGEILNASIIRLILGQNLLFQGAMGTGKNVLVETLAWLFKRPLYEFSMNSQMSNPDLLGTKTMKDGDIVFEPSVIVEAFENGGILLLDEFNMSIANVVVVFNSLLDDRRRLTVPGYKVVKGHKNFVAIATQNPGYLGTFAGNPATIDRFSIILFPESTDIVSIIQSKFDKPINADFLDLCSRFYNMIKAHVQDGIIEPECMQIRSFINAAKIITFTDYDYRKVLEEEVVNKVTAISSDAYEILKNTLSNI